MKVGSNLYGGKKPEQPRWADGTRSFESVLSLFFNPPLLYCGNFQEIFLILLTSIGNGKTTEWSPSDYKSGRPRSVSPILTSQTAQTVQFFFLTLICIWLRCVHLFLTLLITLEQFQFLDTTCVDEANEYQDLHTYQTLPIVMV